MKNNWKFITSVGCIILSSVLLLAGCMTAIAAKADTPRPYQLSVIPQTVADGAGNFNTLNGSQGLVDAQTQSGLDLNEPPVSQEELKAKFSAMYDLSGDNHTICVISQAYLKDFWSSNGEKAVHALSVSEVLYIVQDSIRIYNAYDTVILPGFSADEGPALEEQTIRPKADDRDRAREDVRTIIRYRLQALSSPEAFFSVEQILQYRKMNPETVPEICREVFFYIPNYTAQTDRELYLNDRSYSDSRSKYGVFCFSYFNRMVLFTGGNPETVFPTKELSRQVQGDEVIYLEMSSSWMLSPAYRDTLLGVRSFVLNPREQTFYLTTTGARFDAEQNRVVLEEDCPDFKKWPGTYEKTENRLYLYPHDIPGGILVFDYGTDGSLVFNEAESNQIQLHFEDQSVYQPIDPNP